MIGLTDVALFWTRVLVPSLGAQSTSTSCKAYWARINTNTYLLRRRADTRGGGVTSPSSCESRGDHVVGERHVAPKHRIPFKTSPSTPLNPQHTHHLSFPSLSLGFLITPPQVKALVFLR